MRDYNQIPQKYEGSLENTINNYMPKIGNLEKIDKFLETYTLARPNQANKENLNRTIISNEI